MLIDEDTVLAGKRRSAIGEHPRFTDSEAAELLDCMKPSEEERPVKDVIFFRLNMLFHMFDRDVDRYNERSKLIDRRYIKRIRRKDHPRKLQTLVSAEIDYVWQLEGEDFIRVENLELLHRATRDFLIMQLREHCSEEIPAFRHIIASPENARHYLTSVFATIEKSPSNRGADYAPYYRLLTGLSGLCRDLGITPVRKTDPGNPGNEETGRFLEITRKFLSVLGRYYRHSGDGKSYGDGRMKRIPFQHPGYIEASGLVKSWCSSRST